MARVLSLALAAAVFAFLAYPILQQAARIVA
jgi:hypothetical protein